MSKSYPSHQEELVRLRKIEGQIRGVQRMIEEGRYCIDILVQLTSIVGAIRTVEERILNRHLRSCVLESLAQKPRGHREKKIEEIIDILAKFRRHG